MHVIQLKRVIMVLLMLALCHRATGEVVFYVAQDGQSPVSPYTNGWFNAASNIQTAVTAANTEGLSDVTVKIRPGTYHRISGSHVVLIPSDMSIRLLGVGDPETIIIDGEETYRGIENVANATGVRLAVENMTVTRSYSTGWGSGIRFNRPATGSMIRNCIITHNRSDASSSGQGGGIHLQAPADPVGDVLIENCIITHNYAPLYGAGITVRDTTHVWLRNSLVATNTTDFRGGGIWLQNSNGRMVIENSTIAGNAVLETHGGILNSGAMAITNSIVYHNVAPVNNPNYGGGTITWGHSCTWPLPAGAGNIALDPLFVDRENDNYRLMRHSPCRDTGTNLTWMIGAVDIDGRPRIAPGVGIVDMGAYEIQPVGSVILLR